jgi:hypothetical protein
MDVGFAAEAWSFNSTDQPWPSATFTLRQGNTFHNGDPVTPEDIKFSIEFQKACGPGVAWNYAEYAPIQYVHTQADESALGPRDVKVYFNSASYWAIHWVGFAYILNRNVWMRANSNLGWGYTRGMTDYYNEFINRRMVRDYQPWLYDGDNDGTVDFAEDGSGPWVFGSYAPAGPISAATSIGFSRFTGYVLTQANISDFIAWAFQQFGDINKDSNIDGIDGYALQQAMFTDALIDPWGTGWNYYNPNADINMGVWNSDSMTPGPRGDGIINAFDYGKWGNNFGNLP